MADIDDDEEEDFTPSGTSQGQPGFNAAAFAPVETPNNSSDAATLLDQSRGRPPSYDLLKTEGADRTTAAATPVAYTQPSLRTHSGPSMRDSFFVMPPPGLSNWQEVLYAHARLNAAGQPMDEAGKVINLRDMDPKFGQMLAQTCIDLDAAGYKGQYYILSGVRTHEEQAYLYNYYHSRGSNHPVALPGHSPHEWGLGTDLQFTGAAHDQKKFYAAFYQHGGNNGLEFVRDKYGNVTDENHCQIANCSNVMESKRQQQPVVMASNHSNNKAPAAGPATPSLKPLGLAG